MKVVTASSVSWRENHEVVVVRVGGDSGKVGYDGMQTEMRVERKEF